jgi:hypothetical protein
MLIRPAAAAALLLVAALTYHFPGHTWLQSDTQVYGPILEHQYDPSLFTRELIAQHPHVSYTLYDEIVLGLRKATGMSMFAALKGQQAVWRFAQVAGFYLLATATGLGAPAAVLAAAALSLGATILGPSVLTIEYEPVPRGFAVALLTLGMGLAAHSRFWLAGVALAGSLWYHPPTVAPVAFVLAVAATRRRPGGVWRTLAALGVAAGVLFAAARIQSTEPQILFGRLTPELEQLQRMRASYNWISAWWVTWGNKWLAHYLLMYALGLAAAWRIWGALPTVWRWFALGLPLYGMLSMPVSYLLLEQGKWALMPQFQPMRAVLFVTMIGVLLSVLAAAHAANRGRWAEALGWAIPVYWIPANMWLWDWPPAPRLLSIALLAALMAFALVGQRRPWSGVALAAAAALPFFAIPRFAGVRNYPALHTAEVAELSAWAKARTPRDALFLFPHARRSLDPGIFRVQAQRALYVDWKGGGQVNYFAALAFEWWRRWKEVGDHPNAPLSWYAERGIDYIVVAPGRRYPGAESCFVNSRYRVYATR